MEKEYWIKEGLSWLEEKNFVLLYDDYEIELKLEADKSISFLFNEKILFNLKEGCEYNDLLEWVSEWYLPWITLDKWDLENCEILGYIFALAGCNWRE